MRENIVAVVPVRKGSQRVVDKNIKPFGDTTLLELKLSSLKQVNNVDEIVVNSDCDHMLSIARGMGVSTHKRESHYASSTVNNSEYFEHIARNTACEHLMYSPVTCPFIQVSTFEMLIDMYRHDTMHDSLTTVFPVKHHMWLSGKPINYTPEDAPNSQDLPNIQGISYGVSIISKDLMIKRRNVVGYKPLFHELDEIQSVDIDTELEFKFAEYIYTSNEVNL